KFVLPASSSGGHSMAHFPVKRSFSPAAQKGKGSYTISAINGQQGTVDAPLFIIPEEGTSVISDIDDTIKITEVRNRASMIENTFYREFRPVPGMAELYRRWKDRGMFFHYVSGSPYQLYPDIASFLDSSGFPPGTFHLRELSVHDSSFLSFLNTPEVDEPEEHYKYPAIKRLLEAFPRRKFILVGDSGEMDPELYAFVARQFPGQVQSIVIRNITSEEENADRFRNLEIPEGISFSVFASPVELNSP
ncbi:MAG: App1 family protein, partial [Leptospiraceae bacterium]|nr:App1 family protein [Leptospiraceae bacterium]